MSQICILMGLHCIGFRYTEKIQQFKFIEVYHDTDGRCTKEDSGSDCVNRAKILASDLASSEKPLFLLYLSPWVF